MGPKETAGSHARESLCWILGKDTSPRGWLGTGTAFPGQWSQHKASLISRRACFKEGLGNTLRHAVGFLDQDLWVVVLSHPTQDIPYFCECVTEDN